MSCCPTDGPVLKSILGLYRPAADCLLSLSRCFNILSLSISTNLFFFSFHTLCHPSSPSLPPSPLRCHSLCPSRALSHSLLHLFFLFSPPYLRPPSGHLFHLLFFGLSQFWTHKSLCQLSRSMCPSITLFSPSSLLFSPIVSLTPGVSLSGS